MINPKIFFRILNNNGIDFFTGVPDSLLKGFCNFITGHKRINNPNQDIDYKSIAKNKGKIIIYMGISQIVDISKNLIDSGIDQNRKVSIIYNASLPSQRIFFSKLHNAPEIIKKNKVSPPAIIIID